MLCSSREAVYMTLKNMLDKKDREAPVIGEAAIHRLINKVNEVTQNSKALKVVELIEELDDKVIIFTEYRATQIYLQWFLQQNGISSVPFRGGFKEEKRLDERLVQGQGSGADRHRSGRRRDQPAILQQNHQL